MPFYYDEDPMSSDDIDDQAAHIEAITKVIAIMIDALGETQPLIHKTIIKNLKESIDSMRNTLGEVNEEDIAAYAHTVADRMSEFLPFNENEKDSEFH